MASSSTVPVALVTGGAQRVGRAIATQLHAKGFAVCLHYNRSKAEAETLAAELNSRRPHSAATCAGSLHGHGEDPLHQRCAQVVDDCFSHFGRCDVLINNASAYYSTPLLPRRSSMKGGDSSRGRTEQDVADAAADLFGSNALAPFFLIQQFVRRQPPPYALGTGGDGARNVCVVNLVDAMLGQPLPGFSMYTMAKQALVGLTKSAALELAEVGIRVNGVAPGFSLLPEDMPPEVCGALREKIPLGKREASAEEVAAAVCFLVSDEARYITGSILNVDGGLSLRRA